MQLPNVERARRYLAKCPPAISGHGGHNATFHVAAVLVNGFALGEADALRLLAEWNSRCLPPWNEAELIHKIRSTTMAQHSQPRGHLLGENGVSGISAADRHGAQIQFTAPPPKPFFAPMVLKRVVAKTGAVADVVSFIMERSPVKVQDSATVLRLLYPPGTGEKVLIFSDMKSQGQFVWAADNGMRISSRQLPTGPDGVWFLPQPVDGQFYSNPRLGGKRSRRSEEAVTSWRYAVLESDRAEADDWLRCVIQMPLRIACICESGGRSIHVLVRVDAADKKDWDMKIRTIKPILITLGADGGALSAVRLTRLPQAKRGDRLQRLLYLNNCPEGRPIFGSGLTGKGLG